MSKKLWFAFIAALALLLLPLTVQAGGWAIISLDRLPTDIVANKATQIRFRVLQHGVTPLNNLTPIITAVNRTDKERFTGEAVYNGEVGFYEADLLLPSAGEWAWDIDAFGYSMSMPSLTVQAAPPPPAKVSTSTSPLLMLMTLPLVAVLTFIFSRGWPRSAGRWAVAGVCLVGIFVISFWSMATPSAAQPAAPQPEVSELSQAEIGARLFVAKGCRQCHVNLRAEGETAFSIGPNLTDYRGSAEYLSLWLADPQSLKPETVMPNLNLREDEIEALIAFLTE